MKAVKDTGAYDNTIVIYLSDNGGAKNMQADNTPLKGFKHSYDEGGIHVPFIVSWPGKLKAGSKCDVPVFSFDIMPTVCAAVRIPLPEGRIYDGKNMLPVLQGKADGPLHDALYWDGDSGTWAIREGKWKLTFSKSKKLELYDLDADIGEKNDLAGQHQEVVQRLQEKFKAWRSQMAPRIRRPRGNRNRPASQN